MREPTHVEMQADPAFRERIVRLAWVAAVALGTIYWLARRAAPALPLAHGMLFAGWPLMPFILTVSLRWPILRYALVLPSSLTLTGLLMICVEAPLDSTARLAWLLTTAGVLLGAILGMWFWYRWLPVPSSLAEPFSTGRWLLIGVHVGLIVSGVLTLLLTATL